MKKQKFIERVKSIEVTYDYEDTYFNLLDACVDYMNETGNFDLEGLYDDFITYDTAEEIAKSELEKGGLLRLYCFLGDANLNNNIFKINGYGNLENVVKDDLDYLKEQILEVLSNAK